MFSVIALILLAAIVVLLVALLLRPRAVDSRDDIARLRQLQIEDARALREELASGLQATRCKPISAGNPCAHP
jgi:hypothetical protein